MPVYEYVCLECETKVTETRSITAVEPVHLCRICGNRMNKVYNVGGISFKGSGFYSKDK